MFLHMPGLVTQIELGREKKLHMIATREDLKKTTLIVTTIQTDPIFRKWKKLKDTKAEIE